MFGYKLLSVTPGDVIVDDVIVDDAVLDTTVDVEDDVDDAEAIAMMCVVDVAEGVVYMVAVLNVIVVLTTGGGSPFGGGGSPYGGGGAPSGGGGGGSCP
jgi:uncharacterized membrane protein YgcG